MIVISCGIHCQWNLESMVVFSGIFCKLHLGMVVICSEINSKRTLEMMTYILAFTVSGIKEIRNNSGKI